MSPHNSSRRHSEPLATLASWPWLWVACTCQVWHLWTVHPIRHLHRSCNDLSHVRPVKVISVAQILMLSLQRLVCSRGSSTQGCMFKQPCISMRYLPSLTSLQPGLLQATMRHQQVLEAQAAEFLQWSADSQSCHRAWQAEDWDPEEADAPKDAPAAQSGQRSGRPLYAGTPQLPEGGNPPVPFTGRCVWQQPWPMKCCWQGIVRPSCVGVCASGNIWTLLRAGRQRQLSMLLAVCHHRLWSPACTTPPLVPGFPLPYVQHGATWFNGAT